MHASRMPKHLTKPSPLNEVPEDEGATQAQESLTDVVPAFAAQDQAPEAAEPTQHVLDNPAMVAEPLL